jgi:hypothetical protein
MMTYFTKKKVLILRFSAEITQMTDFSCETVTGFLVALCYIKNVDNINSTKD